MKNELGKGQLVLVNYAHNGYFDSQLKCSETALSHGKFDRVISMGFEDLPSDFRTRNREILSEQRGAGWWCWKPEAILCALERIKPDDVLVYIDCSWTFKKSVRWIMPYLADCEFVLANAIPKIENMKSGRRTILTDCKRFCLDFYGIEPTSHEAKQYLVSGGFIMMRNSYYVKSFMKKWRDSMVHDVLMIDDRFDIPKPEHKGFMRHMNDMGPLNILLSLTENFHTIDNETKLDFLDRIWPREIEYEYVVPKRRI